MDAAWTKVWEQRRLGIAARVDRLARGKMWSYSIQADQYEDTTQSDYDAACRSLEAIEGLLKRNGVELSPLLLPNRVPLGLQPPWSVG